MDWNEIDSTMLDYKVIKCTNHSQLMFLIFSFKMKIQEFYLSLSVFIDKCERKPFNNFMNKLSI